MADENKATVRRLYEEAVNQGNLAVIDEIYSPDVELHLQGAPEDPFGPAQVRRLIEMMRSGFPGLTATVEDMIAEHDKLVVRVTFQRPHDGRFIGVSPRSPRAAWTRIEIFRLFRGRIIEQWSDRDDFALLQQLGVALPPLQPD